MHLDHLTLPLFSAIQVMESLRMPFTEAIQHVQSRRCCIHISEALHNQLREFETIYQNRGVRSLPRLSLLLLFFISDSQTCFAHAYSLRSHEQAGTRRNEHSNQGKITRCSWSEAKRLHVMAATGTHTCHAFPSAHFVASSSEQIVSRCPSLPRHNRILFWI